jgi:hypothetical protein
MGRKAKVAEAIPVPHDGVIHYLLEKENAKEEKNEVGVPDAFVVLTNLSDEESPTQRLWNVLTTATQNRDQLQALQAYRNFLLHHEPLDKVKETEQFVGTYRVLLELSLSHMTNQPLRRAIQTNLDTLSDILGNETAGLIRRNVVSSLWVDKFWVNPLQSLFEALNYAPTKEIIFQDESHLKGAFNLLVETSLSVSDVLDQSSLYSSDGSTPIVVEATEGEVELTTQIATTLKVLLTPLLQQEGIKFTAHMDALKQLQLFLWKGITCSAMDADALSKLGVAYGQTLLVEWLQMTPALMSERAIERIREVVDDNVLPPLNILCTVQGIAVVIPDDVLVYGSPVSLLEDPLATYLLLQCSQATDGPTRLSALRSLQTLLSRCSSIVKGETTVSNGCLAYIDKLTQETLRVVMSAWENPPGRQVASAIPGLFNSLVDLIETIHPNQEKAASGIQGLVGRFLSQPVNRKGRYIALETLLPIIGAKALIDSGGDKLIESLVTGVGDRAHTAGNIAALLGKILSKRREEMNEETGLVLDESTSLNRKQRRKLEQQSTSGTEVQVETPKPQLLPEWIELWAPDFARGLLSKSHVRRKQVSAFCIPLLVTMVGGSSRRMDASFALSVLFTYLEKEYERQKVSGTVLPVLSYDAETVDDIFLWAKLEIVRQASMQKLVSSLSTSEALRASIKGKFPESLLRSSLTHSSQRVRLVAFAALEPVLSTYDSIRTKPEAAYLEMDMWQSALPYAFKSTGKEYIASLLQYLTSFLDRLSLAEADEVDGSASDCQTLPRFGRFVNDFLIGTIIVKQAAYPGTVLEKEQFAVSLLRCIISVAIRDDLLSIDRKVFQKPGQTSLRQIRRCELATLQCVTENLLSVEVLLTLVALCHSIWDATRSEAFTCLISLVQAAKSNNIALPKQFYDESVMTRGLFLSSSPRQREADTGAIILAFASCTKANKTAQENFLVELLALLNERIEKMRGSLSEILMPNDGHASSTVTQKGLALPLAHGLIQSVRRIIETKDANSAQQYSQDTVVRLVNLCIKSIQISLSVVADVKDGETLEGMEGMIVHSAEGTDAVPLNVNTGAIGANAAFATIKHPAESEALRRFATQRIVVGSWLLAKEACATLTSLITYNPNYVPSAVVGRAGQLLITTMTALKHQGAAFAAQKALQQISMHCNSKTATPELRDLPAQWSERLTMEISSAEKVRDSTLRRSTGYGLGFLALMRSELSLKVFPRTLCPHILARLVMLSLPPKSQIEGHADKLGLSHVAVDATSLFSNTLRSHRGNLVFASTSDSTSRVHAFNILRLIILDAPLAQEVAPFVGDCIVSAMIGYTDETWAVRNSATMVFSAAMLRVVDSDKNAVQKDETSSNAITAFEFFRQYAQLKGFLLAVLKDGLHDDQRQDVNFDSCHSPAFLVLLLLSRLQPVRRSGNEAAAFTECFVSHVVGSLSHKDHKVRVIAGRALANIASTDPTKESHTDVLLRNCAEKLGMLSEDWNGKHGALIGIHEILQTLPDPFSALTSTGADRCIRELCDREPHAPPSCFAVAIEIRSYCLQHTIFQQSEVEDLVHFCLGRIEEREPDITKEVAGAATLCNAAGRVASEHLSKLLWTQRNGTSEYAEQLKSLFTCDIIDTRLTATKAFKKAIYRHIDELLLSDVPNPPKAALLEKVAQLLFDSLNVELRRSSSSKRLGAHPPTVRRLSRCLLECLYASRALGSNGLRTSDLWSTSGLMVYDFDIQRVDSDDKTMGNALELMAFSFATSSNDVDIVEKANRFSSLAKKLIDPLGPWRVRHSAACAIDTSGLLTGESPATPRFALQREILKLLQDNDPDVRFVAARAMTERDRSSPFAALFALERAYTGMGSSNRDISLSRYLLTSLVDRYEEVESRMTQVMAELAQSESASDTAAMLNVDTTRKIFEDEDPNPYEEPLLACHLAVSTLVTRGLTLDSNTKECLNLTFIGTSLLKKLEERYSQKEQHCIMNDISRNNSLFPDIAGVLVACIAIVYLDGANTECLQEKARSLLSLCSTNCTMHPDILEALQVLVSVKPGADSTRDSLLQLCFLVPGRV